MQILYCISSQSWTGSVNRIAWRRHNTFSDEHDIIKQVVAFRRWLQQRDEHCVLLSVGQVSQILDDLEGGGRIQASRDFILSE